MYSAKRQLKPVKLVAIILALAMALYSGYWFWLANNFESAIGRWQANLAKQGSSLQFDSLTVSGFPGSLVIHVRNMDVIQAGQGQWQFPLFQVIVNPLHLDTLRVTAPQTNYFKATHQSLDLTMGFNNFMLEHTHDSGNRTQNIRLSTDKLAFLSGTSKAALDNFILDVNVTPALRKPISSFGELKWWTDHNGTVHINRMAMQHNSIRFESSGDLSLSALFQPRFDGTLSIIGVIELLTQLQEEKIIDEKMGGLAKSFITMLNGGKTPQSDQPLIAPVKINEEGMLTIGPLPILKVPTIKWNAL